MSKVNIIFEDGHVFTGERFGADSDAIGEVVFTTSSASYMEDFTDPCCAGQIIMPTFPSLGNFGVIPQDALSDKCKCAAVITRSACDEPSNFRSEGTIDSYLREQGIPGVMGVDTRAITRMLRDSDIPSMRAAITEKSPGEVLDEIKAYKFNGYLNYAGMSEKKLFSPEGEKTAKVALVDFGAPKRQLNALLALRCEVLIVPMGISANEILAEGCSGIVLSEGAGNPMDYSECVPGVAEYFGKLPLFGVGLGHQLMALAKGCLIAELTTGHRGSNVPVRSLETGAVNITTQTHNYCAERETLPDSVKVIYENRNDASVEGLLYEERGTFSIQFHPEAGRRGPEWGFAKFIELLVV